MDKTKNTKQANNVKVPLEGMVIRNADFLHYTNNPVEKLHSVNEQEIAKKPKGFWLSVETGNGDGWKDWCEMEAWNIEDFDITYKIELEEDENILTISTPSELYDFNADYSVKDKWDIVEIDWRRVAKKYDGIIIAPYIYSCRMNRSVGWYYGWDCASGCIWNIDVIEEIYKIESVDV